jgi:hypothetical protein
MDRYLGAWGAARAADRDDAAQEDLPKRNSRFWKSGHQRDRGAARWRPVGKYRTIRQGLLKSRSKG